MCRQGPDRQRAFDLLCRAEIVTKHELCDSAVVPQDHIEECVTIALEMLNSNPIEYWSRRGDGGPQNPFRHR